MMFLYLLIVISILSKSLVTGLPIDCGAGGVQVVGRGDHRELRCVCRGSGGRDGAWILPHFVLIM